MLLRQCNFYQYEPDVVSLSDEHELDFSGQRSFEARLIRKRSGCAKSMMRLPR